MSSSETRQPTLTRCDGQAPVRGAKRRAVWQAGTMEPGSTLLTVIYVGEPDVVFEFNEDGVRRNFGRGDRCEIRIWSAINSLKLSRIAGCIWRMEDELWVRNLSTRHALYIQVPGRPPEEPLPPRRDDGLDKGAARAIPSELAFIRAPDGCKLLVRQLRGASSPNLPETPDEQTTDLPPVPNECKAVAAALCEPLFHGAKMPASYSQIIKRIGLTGMKSARRLVGRLCLVYADEVPMLRERVSERIRKEAKQLGLDGNWVLRCGIWKIDQPTRTEEDEQELAHQSAFMLPDYYEVAHLLVRHWLVTKADVEALAPERL